MINFGSNQKTPQKPFLKEWLSGKNQRTLKAIYESFFVVTDVIVLEKGLLVVLDDFVLWVWRSNPIYETLPKYLLDAVKGTSTVEGVVLKISSRDNWELVTFNDIEIFVLASNTATGAVKYALGYVNG